MALVASISGMGRRPIAFGGDGNDGRLRPATHRLFFRRQGTARFQTQEQQIGLLRLLAGQCLRLRFDGVAFHLPARRVDQFDADTAKVEAMNEIIACGARLVR